MIKVLDIHQDSVSFWYIYGKKQNKIDRIFSPSTDKIKQIKELSEKLKHVRNKTHFHIDKKAVFDPKKVWEEAGITIIEIKSVMQHLHDVLSRLHKDHSGDDFPMPEYTGDDIDQLLRLAADAGLI